MAELLPGKFVASGTILCRATNLSNESLMCRQQTGMTIRRQFRRSMQPDSSNELQTCLRHLHASMAGFVTNELLQILLVTSICIAAERRFGRATTTAHAELTAATVQGLRREQK